MIRHFIVLLQDFFGISRKEARAALVLMVISFLLLWTPFFYHRWLLPMVPVSSSPVDSLKMDSIVAELAKAKPEREFTKSFENTYSKKSADHPVRLFKFDPNHATIEQLEELGIPKFLAKRMDKYRSKGGQFRKKEDLLHIYDFPSDLYQKLVPFIVLPASSTSHESYGKSDKNYPEKYTPKTNNAESKTYVKPAITSFDINTTDTTQLIRLKGIGTKLSLRILKFRDGLGGFHSTAQFAEIFGLDSLALAELNKYAKVIAPVKKLNVNTATAEQLSAHSYLRNKKLASVIVNYRDQHGPYQSLEDLKKVRVLDSQTLEKIRPYLEF
jgi:competence ComEA-like helix-hairpin-helix protein